MALKIVPVQNEKTPHKSPVLKIIILISYKSKDIKYFKNMYKEIVPIKEIINEIFWKIFIRNIDFLSNFKLILFSFIKSLHTCFKGINLYKIILTF